ncbi:G-alpha-domain-containing protein [Sistotremastrum suecicum HHB10207 ss-3]|uniref:G-alpha-domain-containing protein n=1 Tax=Sistotremastrum suecicum HHB10207 ss-3 TaxID=1314776 RepID=A0A166F037_9AGAM|nr:G-alpha-domain-containing protein [Sistotremastrum suecicum HHB10207 ss-3]
MARTEVATLPTTSVPFLDATLYIPPNETPEQRSARLKAEEQAKHASDEIDALLNLERARIKAETSTGRKHTLLLLGQSESGKTTLLKQFQMMHAPKTFNDQRASWKAVIYLNVLNTLRTLLISLRDEPTLRSPEFESLLEISSQLATFEDTVAAKLVESGQFERPQPNSTKVYMRKRPSLDFLKFRRSSSSSTEGSAWPASPELESCLETANQVLTAHLAEIKRLWEDPMVRSYLTGQHQEDWRSFFLNDIDRILVPGYMPTDSDILRCRIATIGITEHKFNLGSRSLFRKNVDNVEWTMYDVAGSRGQRHAWAPYFEDATAIIFMAPLSGFDQYLNEDMTVNRVQDSYELFTKICRNRLLQKTEIVLFFNKMDILQEKLNFGKQISDYVPSYGSRPNDLENAKKYFCSHFEQTFHAHNKTGRSLYVHFTSVVVSLSLRMFLVNSY